MEYAATLFINPLTALGFMNILKVIYFNLTIKDKNSNSVIHTAGASALGRIFTRLCVKNNINIINTIRR